MKKLLLFILPLMAFTFNACSKDDDGDELGGSTKLVKTLTVDDDTHAFIYDSENRIKSVTCKHISYSYQYQGNTVIGTPTVYDPSFVQNYEHYTLNDAGKLMKFEEKDSDGEVLSSIQYTYGSDGYVSKSVSDYGIINYTWHNGNLVTISDGNTTHTITYNDVENKIGSLWVDLPEDLMNLYGQLKGMSPKNYPIAITGSNSNTFTYTFDKDGYPTEIITKGAFTEKRVYTYQ